MRTSTIVALCVVTAALPSSSRAADCSFDPARHRNERQIRAEVSRLAEIVAPSAATGKRRSVLPPKTAWPTAKNFIDVAIFSRMQRDGIAPASISSDTEFLRRVTIDLAGRLPTGDEVVGFLGDAAADKRDRAIDRLLLTEEFNDRWALWLGDLVQNTQFASGMGSGVGAGRTPYYRYMRAAIAANKPYDAIVREMITGTGNTASNGPPNFALRQRQMNGPLQDTYDNLATATGQYFLAMPLNCVSCHDGAGHLEAVNLGLSRVKRTQLWGLSAFFARTQFRPDATAININDQGTGSYRLNTLFGNKTARTPPEGFGDAAMPVYLDGGKPNEGETWRVAYARLLTADRQFARAAVNYLWKEMYGLGIVEPVDGFDLARLQPPVGMKPQPTHPQLLEELTDHFIRTGFDLRALLRTMAQSSTYQLSSRYDAGEWSEAWTEYFARHYPRRMIAEVLLDAVHQATGRTIDVNVVDMGRITRAVQAPDPFSIVVSRGAGPYATFLADFGQGNRDTVMRSNAPSLIQTLTMMNDPMVLRGTKRSQPTHVQTILRETRDPVAITNRLYLATLGRYPTDEERGVAAQYLTAGNIEDRTEDLQYALLNKLEFLFN